MGRHCPPAFAREAGEGCRAVARRAKAGPASASFGSASHTEPLRDLRVHPPEHEIPRSILFDPLYPCVTISYKSVARYETR
jgi:hypothetical protein